MYSPALAVVVALLVTAMSALRSEERRVGDEWRAGLPSAGDWPLRLAVLLMLDTVEDDLIWARVLTVSEAPAASGPAARLPVQALPVLGSHSARRRYLACGRDWGWVVWSAAVLLSDGPLLETVRV